MLPAVHPGPDCIRIRNVLDRTVAILGELIQLFRREPEARCRLVPSHDDLEATGLQQRLHREHVEVEVHVGEVSLLLRPNLEDLSFLPVATAHDHLLDGVNEVVLPGGLHKKNSRRYVGQGPDCEDRELLLFLALLLVCFVKLLQLFDDRDACVGLNLLMDVVMLECARVAPGLEELICAQVHFAPRDWEAASLVGSPPLDVDSIVHHYQIVERGVGRGARAIAKHVGHADDVEEGGQVEHRYHCEAVVLVCKAVD
mmetsp:Transcript_5744/g.10373  ORF Transcript_5744/g.10373 Transcript_5744/m.10373 type:complete len:256 (+) Transcript_5744:906-1673(+)